MRPPNFPAGPRASRYRSEKGATRAQQRERRRKRAGQPPYLDGLRMAALWSLGKRP